MKIGIGSAVECSGKLNVRQLAIFINEQMSNNILYVCMLDYTDSQPFQLVNEHFMFFSILFPRVLSAGAIHTLSDVSSPMLTRCGEI